MYNVYIYNARFKTIGNDVKQLVLSNAAAEVYNIVARFIKQLKSCSVWTCRMVLTTVVHVAEPVEDYKDPIV